MKKEGKLLENMVKKKSYVKLMRNTETYWRPFQTSKMEHFVKTVNGF